MSLEFKVASLVSIAAHALILAGVPITQPPAFDVERAPTSIELYLLSPKPPTLQPVVTEAPTKTKPVEEQTAKSEETASETLVSKERKGASVDILPSYLRNPAPVYPRLARQQGYQGTVLLEIEVSASGRCGRVLVVSSSGHPVLDQAAVEGVRKWVFRPAQRFQQPIAFWVEIPVTFRLVDDSEAVVIP